LCVYTVSGKCVAAGIADRYYGTDITNTYSLTPWSRSFLEKLTGIQLVNISTHFMEPEGSLPHSQMLLCVYFLTRYVFYDEDMLEPRPTPKLEDQPLSAVRDCLFNIFAATLHIGGRSSIRNLRTRHAVVTGNHLSRDITNKISNL